MGAIAAEAVVVAVRPDAPSAPAPGGFAGGRLGRWALGGRGLAGMILPLIAEVALRASWRVGRTGSAGGN